MSLERTPVIDLERYFTAVIYYRRFRKSRLIKHRINYRDNELYRSLDFFRKFVVDCKRRLESDRRRILLTESERILLNFVTFLVGIGNSREVRRIARRVVIEYEFRNTAIRLRIPATAYAYRIDGKVENRVVGAAVCPGSYYRIGYTYLNGILACVELSERIAVVSKLKICADQIPIPDYERISRSVVISRIELENGRIYKHYFISKSISYVFVILIRYLDVVFISNVKSDNELFAVSRIIYGIIIHFETVDIRNNVLNYALRQNAVRKFDRRFSLILVPTRYYNAEFRYCKRYDDVLERSVAPEDVLSSVRVMLGFDRERDLVSSRVISRVLRISVTAVACEILAVGRILRVSCVISLPIGLSFTHCHNIVTYSVEYFEAVIESRYLQSVSGYRPLELEILRRAASEPRGAVRILESYNYLISSGVRSLSDAVDIFAASYFYVIVAVLSDIIGKNIYFATGIRFVRKRRHLDTLFGNAERKLD